MTPTLQKSEGFRVKAPEGEDVVFTSNPQRLTATMKTDRGHTMHTPSKLLTRKLLEKGFLDIEIDLFVKDILRMVQDNPGISLKDLRNRLDLLGWNHSMANHSLIQMVRDHCDVTELA